jgi:hypothetical protein
MRTLNVNGSNTAYNRMVPSPINTMHIPSDRNNGPESIICKVDGLTFTVLATFGAVSGRGRGGSSAHGHPGDTNNLI